MQPRFPRLILLCTLGFVASHLGACGDGTKDGSGGSQGTGAVGGGAAGGTVAGGIAAAGTGIAGSGFNQCGVAAPLPVETGQCTAVSAPTITDFDDYAGGEAASYTYYVNAKPPAPGAMLGAILHIGDGSETDGGTSVITTEMVAGEGETGYALQFSNTNATHWGGLLMFHFPSQGTTTTCMDAHGYGGLEFSIKGASPSGRFGVTLGMLDTMPTSDHGICTNPTASDCKDTTLELALPADPATWKQVQVPWSSFTPGVGSALSCVPVTGQNIVRLVIQPFMNYPPPDYTFAPGPYQIAIDNVRLY